MQLRWVLSKFHYDNDGHNVPIASDYGGKWFCPVQPSTPGGMALVQVYLNYQQIEAMGSDPRVSVCPLAFDPRPISTQLQTTYAANGATSSMTFSELLATLADEFPQYAHTL